MVRLGAATKCPKDFDTSQCPQLDTSQYNLIKAGKYSYKDSGASCPENSDYSKCPARCKSSSECLLVFLPLPRTCLIKTARLAPAKCAITMMKRRTGEKKKEKKILSI